mgnify:CR=1 FL=1|jgi:hypothetical protein|tara:strand:+ start:187 stop:297 length:111 start_codon:yes stop_codon:yes gene_type:complete
MQSELEKRVEMLEEQVKKFKKDIVNIAVILKSMETK